MKPSRYLCSLILIPAVAVALFVKVNIETQAAGPDPSPEKVVQGAWKLAQESGVYHFNTDLEQTTYPAPAIANVGKSSSTEIYYMKGEVNLEADSLYLTLWQNDGNITSQKDGIEIRVEGEKAFGRANGGDWQKLDNFSGLFAPASDPMAYLAGGKNFRLSSSQGSATRFTFELDGPAFAAHMRDLLEKQLRRSGELPVGLNLDSSRAYQQMTGQGEIWLDGNGLPLRLSVNLELPDAKTGERLSAIIKTDFSGFSAEAAIAGAVDHPSLPIEWSSRLPEIILGGIFCGGLALFFAFFLFRRSRKVYAVIVTAVILSMVGTPLLQSAKVSAFYETQYQRQTASEAAQQEQANAQKAKDDLLSSNWDPHQEPLAANDLLPEAGNEVVVNTIEGAMGSHETMAPNDQAETTDSDQDGLTDDLERELGTEANDADSDGDGINDGVELLRLGTDPLRKDTDGDGIYDNVEIEGFVDGNGVRWYLDPNNADTNKDNRSDTLECSSLVGQDDADGLQCADTDGDGTPDAFDRDDDGDGVADPIDLFPDGMLDRAGKHTNGSSPNPFDTDHPFQLKVSSLELDRPVFVDFQLRTQNPEHLTYALNVLDWPSEDIEGQIQHVKRTTFANLMTTEQVESNPSLANGDMQLIPMLEISIPGSQAPLATTTPKTEVEFRGDISATIKLEQNASNQDYTNFSFEFENAGSHTVKLYEGACPASGTPLRTFNNVQDGQSRTLAATSDNKLTALANGEHALVVSEGAQSGCATIDNLINGPYPYKMIDPEPLRPYGISVREVDGNGSLAAYVPLSMVPDETGGGRSAFSARMVYQVSQNETWQRAQQVRVVWVLEMLTDSCNPEGFESYWADKLANDPMLVTQEGAKDEAFRTWCSQPEHRTDDQTEIIHTYDDAWFLTGLSVYEDHGLDIAVAYEDSVHGDVTYNTDLWQLAMGLGSTFLSAHDCADNISSNNPDYDPDTGRCHKDGYRDISVYSFDPEGERLGNTDIYSRFDQNGSVADGDDQRWGIPKEALHVQRFRYDSQDYLAYMTMTEVPKILGNNFAQSANPTLLFAREEHYRAANLFDTSKSGNVFNVNMSASSSPEEVIAGLKWLPYQYDEGSGWASIPVNEYWDSLEILYSDLFKLTNPEDSEKANLGRAIFARSYYVSLMQGMVQQVQDGSKVLSQYDPEGEDSDSLMSDLVGTGAALARMGKAVVKWIGRIVMDTYDFYGLRNMLAVSSGSMGNQATQIKTQILLESAADSIAINTYGPWKTFFSGGIKSKLGGSLAIAGAIAVVGLTIYGATQQSNPLESVQIVLLGLGALTAIQTVAVQAQALIQAVESAGSLTAALKNGFASATVQAQAAANKGAVVGMIIGVVIAWGAIAVQAGLSYGMGGGMSRIAWGTAIATAIAATVVAVIMFAISIIPVVGQIIAAIIGLIDAVIGLVCTVVLGDDQAENAAANWFCGGLTGLVTKTFAVLIYSGNVMVELYPEDATRLEFYDFGADDLVNPDLGISVGNEVKYSLSITNTIKIAPLPDDLGAAYRYQYNDKQLRSSSFVYELSITNTVELHDGLDRYTTTDWAYVDGNGPEWGDFGHTWHKAEPVYINRTLQNEDGIPFERAGINQSIPLYLLEGWSIPSQNCILGVCTIWTDRGTENYDLGSGIKFDVFPASLDEFYALASKDGGYALDWGGSGEASFPRLVDADGDGIPYPIDAHDNAWDNDGDGLSDGYEMKAGSDPDHKDSDGDGLADNLELIAGTNPLRSDSDGDGLTDGLEVFHQDIFDQDQDGNITEWLGGWEYAYDINPDGSLQTTWVIPSPLNADSDGDTLSDYLEKTYGFNPNWVSDPNVLTFSSSISEADGGGYTASDGFVLPGDSLYYSASVENELYNRWAHGLLDTDFPAVFSSDAIAPQPFLIYPNEKQELEGEVTVSDVASSGVYSLTQTAGALISDWAELAGGADLWYPFEDDSRAIQFADRSGSIPPHDGTCSNSTPGAGCVPVKDDGLYGGGIRFDGTAHIASDYDPSDSAYGISLWFKTTAPDGGLFELPGFWDRWLYLEAGKVKAKMYNGGTFETLASAQTYNDGKWHHVVHTFGGAAGGQKLYVDGQQVAKGNLASARASSNGIRLGYANTNSVGYFTGKMDDVRIYRHGLAFTEVQMLFNTPILDLHFSDHSTWKDASPFGNNANCSGTCPTKVDGIEGQAVNFRGSQYITVASDDSLKLNRGGFTIGVWIYPTDSPEYCYERELYSSQCAEMRPQPQGILGFGTGEGNAYPSLQRVGNQLRFTYGDIPYFTTGDVLRPNKWNHVAVTYDGSAVLIYVNGEKVAEDSTQFTSPPPGTKTLTIGRTGTAATLEVKKIRVDDEGDGSGKAEFCMAFQSYGNWQTVFDQQVDGGLVDAYYFPLLYNVNSGPFEFISNAYLLAWEDDGGEHCVTNNNKGNITPQDDGDDNMGLWTFNTDNVSEGFDRVFSTNPGSDPNRHYAVKNYSGDASGYFYYVYHNDSIPFYGKIDEVLIYNRSFDAESVLEMYQAQRLSLNLKFDDAPGETSFVDSSFGQHNASCSGENCPTTGTAGRVNQSALFDGNDFLSLANSGINRLTNEFSIAAWIKPNSVSGYHRILATARTKSNNGFAFGTYEDGLRFTTFGIKDYNLPDLGIEAGKWTHVAVVMGADNAASFYVNGTLQGKVNGTSPATPDNDDALLIGATTGNGDASYSQFFEGRMDDLYIFSNPLGEAGIQNLYKKAPIFQLHLDEAEGARIFKDDSNFSSNGVCSGTQCPKTGFWIDGQIGTAAEFDGVNDSISAAYNLNQVFGKMRTISAWVYPTAIKDSLQPLAVNVSNYDGNPQYGLYIKPNSMTPQFRLWNCSTQVILDSETPLIMNAWNQVTATYDPIPNSMTIYVNGSPQGSRTKPGNLCYAYGPMKIGGGVQNTSSFYGRIDEVSLYEDPLSAKEIAETFNYQGKWVEERQSHPITIDDDNPSTALQTSGDRLPNSDVQMMITASDPTSGIQRVQLGVKGPGESSYTWRDAPACQDAAAEAAWCPTFIPSGEGAYNLRARATDLVGHTTSADATVYVDNRAPTATFDFNSDALLLPSLSDAQANTWELDLSGTISDPKIGSAAGSGVSKDSLRVSVFDKNGSLVGTAPQHPNLINGSWSLSYPMSGPHPSGVFTVTLQATDQIALRAGLDQNQINRHSMEISRAIQIDASPPVVNLDLSGTPDIITDTQTLQGKASEGPAQVQVTWETDANADQLGLSIRCDGLLVKQIEPGTLQPLAEAYTWKGDFRRGAACQISLIDTGGDGGTRGSVKVCQEEISTWEGNFGSGHSVNFNADASACGPILDAAGVAGVETAFVPLLPGSPFYLQEPTAGTAVHLPFDDLPTTNGDLSFRDISGNKLDGACDGEACPTPGQAGHLANAVYFDGLDDQVTLAQSQNMGARDQLSVAVWLAPSAGSSGMVMVKENEFAIYRNPDNGRISWMVGNTNPGWGTWQDTGFSAPEGQWTHLSLVYEHGTVRTYANGVLVHTYNGAGSIPNLSPLTIGQGSNLGYRGLMDDFQTFDRALTAGEIRSLHLGAGPVLDLRLDKAWASNGTSLPDDSGWAQDGILSTGGNDSLNKAVPGKVGPYALDFDGRNDSISVPDSPALDLGQFSVGLWVKPDTWSYSEDNPLLLKGMRDGSNLNYGFYITKQGKLSFRFYDAACTGRHNLETGGISLDQWSFLLATYDGNQASLYLDGQPVRSQLISGGVCQNNQALTIGETPGGGTTYRGSIDNVLIYPRAVSEAEARGLYAAGWQAATTTPNGAGAKQADWEASVPAGLEGTFRLDLRAADTNGIYSQPKTAWQGEIDTMDPRVSLEAQVSGETIQYTTTAQDWNLSEEGYSTPCGNGVVSQREDYPSAWYRALLTSEPRLNQLSTQCERSIGELPGEIGAYDTPGLAYGIAISNTTAYIADRTAGLRILNTSNPLEPEETGFLDGVNAVAVDIASGGPVLQPDLVVESIVTDPASPEINQGFAITVTIRNQGSGTAWNFAANLFQDILPGPCQGSSAPWTAAIPKLAAGESAEVRFSHPGLSDLNLHALYAKADGICSVVESDEANNLFGPQDIHAVQPDLVVGSISFEPATPLENQPITVSMVITNQGSMATGVFTSSVYVDQSINAGNCGVPGWESATIQSLGAGDSRTISFFHPGFGNPGWHDFLAFVDSECSVSETEELDNVSGKQVQILPTPKADLVVENWQTSNSTPLINEPFVVTATVRNQGTAASGAFTTTVFLNNQPTVCGDLVGQWDAARTGNLNPGEAAEIRFTHPGLAPTGQYVVTAEADSHCEIDELDETNNTSYLLYIDVLDTNQPDLIIENIVTEPVTPTIGQSVMVSVTVRNQGAGSAQNFDTTFYFDHIPSACDEGSPDWYFAHTDTMAAGASTVVTTTYSGFNLAGEHHIYAQADGTCTAIESNENNNISGPQSITVTGGAPISDLDIERIDTQPYNPTVGEPFTITVKVRNRGTIATGSFDTGIFINQDPANTCFAPNVWDLQMTSLGPWAETSLTFNHPGLPEGGTNDIFAMADYTCNEFEYDETNNTTSTSIYFNSAPAAPVGTDASPIIPETNTLSDNPFPAERAITPDFPIVKLVPATRDSTTIDILAAAAQTYTYAYVASTSGLAIVDVSDPGSPALVSTLPIAGAMRDVQAAGDITYLVSQFDGLHAVDTSNPGYPALLDTYDTQGNAEGLALMGSYALVADGLAGVEIIDASDPNSLSFKANFDTPGYAYGIDVSGTTAYVADGSGGLQILDLSDPLAPQLLGSLTANCFALEVSVLDNLAYVATGSKGLAVIDVSDPANPEMVRRFETPGYASDLVVTGNPMVLAYVADQNAGLRILNPSGYTPEATACDSAGHCTSLQMTQTLANLVHTALDKNPDAEFNFPLASSQLSVEILNLPDVLDNTDPLSISGVATSTLTTLQGITVTMDGAPLTVTGWSSGTQESGWQADWTPAGDGPHLLQVTISGADGSQTSKTATVTVDTTAPTVNFSPTTYTSADYHEPGTIDLGGTYGDQGGITQVEVRTPNGEWRIASLENGLWRAGWQLDPGPLPDHQDFSLFARATDVAGHVTEISQTITLDLMPPEVADLTLTANGSPVLPGEVLREPAVQFGLSWNESSDGSGIKDYQARWTTQVTQSISTESMQTIPAAGPLISTYAAADGQKISVELGIQDNLENQRWQRFGSVVVDSPLTPDYIVLPASSNGEVYRGWMESGCTLLGTDRRANRIYSNIPEQKLYASWDAQALHLAWTGANWNTDGDLFIYLDTGAGGSQQVFDPFGASYAISLPEGMLADYLVWVKDGHTADLLHWEGAWTITNQGLPLSKYQWSGASQQGTPATDLYLDFDQIGLTPGSGLSMVGIATENDALNLWATLPNANLANSKKALGRVFTPDNEGDFQLSHAYHWDSLGAGICPNGSNQPEAGAYLDTDLQVDVSADPAGVSYNLVGDGLFWLQDLLLGSPPADVSTQLDLLGGGQTPLYPGQTVTYTLSYRNQGTETAYGAFANLEALYAMKLPGGNSIPIGDVPAGVSGSISFTGVVDSAASTEPWAGIAVKIYDATYPPGGDPIEWLWTQHRVDSNGPEFFGVQQPAYLLGPGSNNLMGYAYDPAGVKNLEVLIQGSNGTQSLHCPDDTPTDGSWNCAWDASGSNNEILSLQLKASDGYNQASEWQKGPTFLLDTQAPTVTLDVGASNVASGDLINQANFTLYGVVEDNGGLGDVEVCVDGDCGAANLQLNPGQAAASIEDIPEVPIPINGGTTCNGGEITVSFEVTQTFKASDIQVGFAAEHAHRDDLQASLRSPAGTIVELLTDDGISGTNFQNADFWFNDAAPLDFTAALGDHDPGLPFYEHLARSAQPLHSFLGEEAAGTWTLQICDLNPAADEGAYLRSKLVITPQDVHAKSGRWSRQVLIPDAENLDYATKKIAVYGQDLVGNRSSSPVAMDLIIDQVAPLITVTSRATQGTAGNTLSALKGTVSDGGPTTYLSIAVYPPEGDPYQAQASRSGIDWQFDLELAQEGIYTLWANASDLAGNTSTAGPFEVSAEPVRETYLPSVMSGFSSGPDLVIQHILVTEDNIQVTLANTGNMPVDKAFWVDVYINPEPLPTAVNQRWDQLCEQGLAWGVTDVSNLTPGGTLTLELNDPSFLAEYSSFSGQFSPEMAIYGQVDSYADTPYGGVLELQEKDGGAYNNILGPVFPLPIQLGQNKSAAAPSPIHIDQIEPLPERAPEAR